MFSVSVVVPTHNRGDRLPRMLAPLLADPAAAEVIVVADGCTDDTEALLRAWSAREPRLRPIFQHPNVGQQAARHRGVEAVRSAFVLCLDDDVVVEEGAVTRVATRAKKGPVVIVGYMPVDQVPPWEEPGTALYARWYEENCSRWDGHPDELLLSLWAGLVGAPRDDYLLAASAACDPDLRYHDDTELGFQLRRRGLQAEFDREVRGRHEMLRGVAEIMRDARRSAADMPVLRKRYPEEFAEVDALWPPAAPGRRHRATLATSTGRTRRPALAAARVGLHVARITRRGGLATRIVGAVGYAEVESLRGDDGGSGPTD